MKIITDDAAYVQKVDLNYLDSLNIQTTRSIYLSVFDWGKTRLTEENQFDFYKYDEDEDIKYFKNIDWMVDYDEVKDCSCEELNKMVETIKVEIEDMANRFNNMNQKEKMDNEKLSMRCRLLAYKAHNLNEFIKYKKGQINFELPEGFEIERKNNNVESSRGTNK